MQITDSLLRKLNYGAFGLHLASAIGLILAFSIVRKKVNFDTGLWTYKLTSISQDNRDITLEPYDYFSKKQLATKN